MLQNDHIGIHSECSNESIVPVKNIKQLGKKWSGH